MNKLLMKMNILLFVFAIFCIVLYGCMIANQNNTLEYNYNNCTIHLPEEIDCARKNDTLIIYKTIISDDKQTREIYIKYK